MRESALDADFCRAKLPGFDCFLRDLIEAQEIGVVLARAAAEGAELATNETNVREIDIAIYDVGNQIARQFRPQFV